MSAILPAASVLLTREAGSPLVYVVHRSPDLRFFGDFWAFPGGKGCADDTAVAERFAGADVRLMSRKVAAARELFEETGVLVARTPSGSFPVPSVEWPAWRRGLLEENLTFSRLLAEQKLTFCPDDFRLIGEVTTPAFAPMRFATTFFVAHLPPAQQPEVFSGELVEGRWSSAADMLACWGRGECLLSPPTIMTLEAIKDRAADDAPTRLGSLLAVLAAGRIHPIFFAPAVQLIPLRTVALPPATHTNAFLVGTGPVYLIDPGASDPIEQQALFEVLDEAAAAGRKLTAIVLTHHHPDHIGAVAVCARRYGVPVWGHPRTADMLTAKVQVTRLIQDGEHLDLGTCPDGSASWHMEAIHTPGHAPGHLAFFEPRYRLLFAGDLVSTVTSIVIGPPPEGDLAEYLNSLRRVRGYNARLLLPSHGNVSARPFETLDGALDHRARREAQLVAGLQAGPRTIRDLGPELYRGLAEHLMRFAYWQVEAGLRKLEQEGRAACRERGEQTEWFLTSSQ